MAVTRWIRAFIAACVAIFMATGPGVARPMTTGGITSITFHGGERRPGKSAAFDFVITDTTPIGRFYLVQRPSRPIAKLKPPGEITRETTPW